jgi:hypothetical protein
MKAMQHSLAAVVVSMFALQASAWAQQSPPAAKTYQPKVGQAGKDVVWVPTPQALVDRMLDMAALTPQDRLVDLGSGDGRTVITAAQRGIPSRGIEFNGEMVTLAKQAARDAGVQDKAVFEEGDIFKTDFSEATVVTMFLLPSLNVKLRPILLDMKPGTRILSNSFTMDDWEPDETARAVQDCSAYCSAYKWIVPAKVAGTWKMDGKELVLRQKYQMIEGTLRDGSNELPISNGRLTGDEIQFAAGGQTYTGNVSGNQMKGSSQGQGEWTAERAS